MPFGPSQFVGGLVGGFRSESDSMRQSNEAEAARQQQRDDKVFDALANSDDPDIRAAAVTGLITGNHPARALDKFFGKTQEHPAFEQIKGLVADGHQAFPGATEQETRSTAAKTTGVFRGAEQSKIPLTDQDKTDVFRSMHGAARKGVNRVPIVMTLDDGSEKAGSFDPSDGSYWDQSENQVWDVKGYRRATPNPSTAGGRTVTGSSALTPEQFRAQYPEFAGSVSTAKPGDVVSFRLGADGKPALITVSDKPPGPGETYSPVYDASGDLQKFGNRSGAVSPAGGGTGVQRPSTPSEKLGALRAVHSDIFQLVPNAKPLATGLQPGTRETATVTAARDAEAVKHRFKNFADLEAQIGAAAGGVGAATPPPPAVSGAPAGGPPGPSGPPRVAPAPGKQGGKGKTAGASSTDPVVDAILKQLNRQ